MSEQGFTWTSQSGSVIASVYEASTADGMNEEGLVANLLFLVESEYPDADEDRRPKMGAISPREANSRGGSSDESRWLRAGAKELAWSVLKRRDNLTNKHKGASSTFYQR